MTPPPVHHRTGERIVYDDNGLPVIVPEAGGAPGVETGGNRNREEPRTLKKGKAAIAMFARRPLIGVKKIKPEGLEISLDETISPVRNFGYAPQAIVVTDEGSVQVARLRKESFAIQQDGPAGQNQVIGTVVSSDPSLPPDAVMVLDSPFVAGNLERIRLFATYATIIRQFIEVTVYRQNPIDFIVAGLPIPQEIVIWFNRFIRLPTQFNDSLPGPIPIIEIVVDERVEIPYALPFETQEGARAGSGLGIPGFPTTPSITLTTPKFYIQASIFTMDPAAVLQWRLIFEDGGRANTRDLTAGGI